MSTVSLDPASRSRFDDDGFVLLRGAFAADRVAALRAGVEAMVQRARDGQVELRWVDEAAGLPDRVSHMLHPDKYQPAFGDWLDADVAGPVETLLQAPARHSLFGMLAGGAGHGYRLGWHRDLGKPGADDEAQHLARFRGQLLQCNAPILDVDTFLHVVPGSHRRASTAVQLAAARAGVDDADMPDAIEVCLEPGDILYYDPNLWHRGWNPAGRARWTLHAAWWRADVPVWTHEHGQAAALGQPAHLERLPPRTRTWVQRYLDVHGEAPRRLQDA